HALALTEETSGRLFEEPGILRLPRNAGRLEFSYTAPSFSAPEDIRFRYQLEGFDDHWIDGGPFRQAGYPRLPAGNYRFKVKACNSDGVWSDDAATFAFAVLPCFWETWWFRFIAIAGLMGAVALLVRYVSFRRLRFSLRQAEQEAPLGRERARIARDIHDDVGGTLTEIGMLIDLAL